MTQPPGCIHPTIFFLCPDVDLPSGGIKVLYRHVDILNHAGFRAFILHQAAGFRCTWFANNTAVTSMGSAHITNEDYLVTPEVYGRQINSIHGPKKIIFNQNAYYTFRDHTFDRFDRLTPYSDPEVLSVMVVSEDNYNYLRYTFPSLQIYRVHNSFDIHRFSFSYEKKSQICFMPRKNASDAIQVINILKFRGVLEHFDIVSIDNMSEAQVAQVMMDSAIFLSFGYPEGFALPPIEAMLCGCIVIGYHGMGGKEYFKPEFSYPIDIGDILGFSRTVEEVTQKYLLDPGAFRPQLEAASAFVRDEYSSEREHDEIVRFWTGIMSRGLDSAPVSISVRV